MKTRKSPAPPVVGGVSLLIIFAVLCLIIFSLLTISTAMAESRLSTANATAVEKYYQADLQAEEIFSLLRLGQIPDGVTQEGNLFFYSCPISPTLNLEVTLRLDGQTWTVLQWQSVSSNT
ncbi:MAG: hypothetical protein E7487_03730 [Ruminococcaceae bacterium]|nr:hypothetical protein [Oscillospiraceae bacterium]